MALSANTMWEVRNGGSNTNGGGFVSGASGTDWAQQDAAQYSVTDAVTAGTTTITSASANFGTDVVGNILYIQGGTGAITAGWYQITVRNSSTSITVDRSTGLNVGTGATLRIGGAMATIAGTTPQMITGNILYIKKGSGWTLTGSAISLPSTGRQYIGYDAVRGDGGQAVFDASGMTASANTFTVGDHITVRNFRVNSSRAIAFNGPNQSVCVNCTASAALSTGFSSIQSCIGCYATGCVTGFSACGFMFACIAESTTTGHGFNLTTGAKGIINCIAKGCGSSGTVHGFNTGEGSHLVNCVAYGSRNNGFNMANMAYCSGCIAVTNGGYGFSTTGDNGRPGVHNCVSYNNTSGSSNGLLAAAETVTALSGDPFVSASTGNFSLNNTAGAGAVCRAAGYPTSFLNAGGTTGYPDIGVVQHQDSGGNVINIIQRKRKVR